MTPTGIKAELPAPAGEKSLSDGEKLTTTPEIRGTVKKKISKVQSPAGATQLIISSGNIVPTHQYRGPSLEKPGGSKGRPDSYRDTGGERKIAAGAKTPSTLKTPISNGARGTANIEEVSTPSTAREAHGANVAPIEPRSDVAEILPSHGGERGAHGKVEEPIRLDSGHVDGRAAFAEKGTNIGRSRVTEGTGRSDNPVPPVDLGKSMRTVRSGNSPRDKVVRGDAAGAVHTPLKQNPGERARGLATRSKASAPPSASGVQGADIPSVASGSAAAEKILSLGVWEVTSGRAGEPVRFGNRHVDRQTVLTGTGSVSDGNAATVETGGSGSTGAPGVATQVAPRGTESGQDDGGKGAAIAESPSPFKTSPGGVPVHPPITGKKVSQLSNAFSAQAPDAVPREAGSDAAGMPSARGEHQNTPGETEEAVQFLQRQVRKEAASAERGVGPGSMRWRSKGVEAMMRRPWESAANRHAPAAVSPGRIAGAKRLPPGLPLRRSERAQLSVFTNP
jgi:hypothetical protein